MLRKLVLILSAFPLGAAILPDHIGDFVKGETHIVTAPDPELYKEFGFQAAEQAPYTARQKRFTATVWRLQDSTGALALFETQRPASAAPAKVAALFAKTPDGAVTAFGNYVFEFTGPLPEQKDLELLYAGLPKVDRTPLPSLLGYLPQGRLIPNSERYILGPASLARFEPRIAPALAAFHLGAEAQLGRYRTPKGDLTLAVFSYPTPNMARAQVEEFGKTPGTIAKRSGPLVGVIVQAPDKAAAEAVLAAVNYEGQLTSNEKVPENPAQFLAKLFLTMFALTGVLIALSVVVGIGFGGFRVLRRRMGWWHEDEPFVRLDIGDK